MNSWIACINNAIEGLLNGTKTVNFNIYREASGDPGSSTRDPEGRKWSADRRLSEDESLSVLEILRTDPSNHSCAECGTPWTDWCVINLGIVVCIGE